jgi:outer membrane protein assembly factor BamE (lipoprotein component of BamABCDE complex)
MIKAIVKDVESGAIPAYERSFNDTFLYKIYKGKKQMYSDHDETMPGVTMYFQNRHEPATTIVYCPNINDAIEIVEYQETHRIAIERSQKTIGDYIRKNKMY